MDLAVQIRDLQKSYLPGVPVLQDLDFDLRVGEVHALIGANGAGKSTLAKILTGLTPRNAGDIQLFGKPHAPASRQDATRAGVGMVLQELNIIPTLTVAENLFLHALPHSFGMVDHGQLESMARTALSRIGLHGIASDEPAGNLGVGQQQMVEIAGALAQESSVLILDEPTAALTGPEIDRLFENIGRLRKQGVAIIYVSHRMEEIARIADRITVLRDGRRVSTHSADAVDTAQLVREMAGADIAERRPRPTPATDAQVGLSVSNLHSGQAVRGVSFSAHRGEILGVAGLIGSGRTETLRAIFGADPIDSGEVRLAGDARMEARTPSDAVRAGIAMIPEDRKHDGLLLSKSITFNASLACAENFAARGFLDHASEFAATEKVCDRLEVKRDSLEQAVGDLSGGNQQKIVIGRWLLLDCEVFLFDEPTRGVDVAAKEAIYKLLDELAQSGKTLVVVSSDLAELMTISHRIAVMSNGRISGEFTPNNWSQEKITAAAFAGYDNPVQAA